MNITEEIFIGVAAAAAGAAFVVGMMSFMLFLTLTDQKRTNRRRIKEMLLEIKNDPEKLSAVKTLLDGGILAETGYVELLLLNGEMIISKMEAIPEIPPMIERQKITPYWQKIFQQMEQNGWNINELKI